MKVRDAMTRNVRMIHPDDTIRDAAKIMEEIDAGVLPVSADDRIVGMITDRDIAIRGIAHDCGPETSVREVMTGEVKYCFEDEDIDHVCRNMAEIKVRRLPVLNREKRLVGIVSIGDLAQARGEAAAAGEALSHIAEPGGPHMTTGSEARH